MSWVSRFTARAHGLLQRQRLDHELDDELRFHLEMQEDANLEAGMDPIEARQAALRSFGDRETIKETYRERRTFSSIETTMKDLRYAARTLRNSLGFTLTAITVLALAIAANVAMFSVLNGVLFRPLPYRAPDQLAILWNEDLTRNFRQGRSALWDVEQYRNQTRSFAELATFDSVATMLTTSEGVEQISGASISPNLLSLLGVQPTLGRSFSAEEASTNEPLVLISHAFWQDRFGGSRDALGATLVANGRSARIIGVLPADFRLGTLAADVWESHNPRQSVRGREAWHVIGRLQPNANIEQAQTEMNAIARGLNELLPVKERNRTISVVPWALQLVGPQSRLGLWMLSAAVFCVFLIAAANVTSLSLARSVAREKEMAVRAALGASSARIVRQLLAEGLLLAATAGLIGTLLAAAAIQLIRTFGPANLARLNEISIDFRVLGSALVICLLAGALVGLPPAIATLRRRELRPSSLEGSRSVTGGTGIRSTRRALVVADFALAIVLLAAAGLLVRSLWMVNRINPGFNPAGVLMMEVSAPLTFTIPAKQQFYERALQSARAVTGVQEAGLIGEFFIDNNREQVVTAERDDGIVTERLQFLSEEVSADFFKVTGTPLQRGRFFSTSDRPDATPVSVINEAMGKHLWAGADPIGKRFKLGPVDGPTPWFTVIGIVGDMRRQGPERLPFPQMFVSVAQAAPPRNMDLLIRTAASDNPQAMVGAIRSALRDVDPSAPILTLGTLEQQFGTYLAQRRFQTSLLTAFSVVGLIMAAVGIYGLIQYSITTRTREIGIRLAVGADAKEIFRMILGEGLKLCLSGLALGLLGALALGQLGSGLLFGVTATDPSTFILVSLLLVAVAVAACCFPARRAMKIEPIVALRQP